MQNNLPKNIIGLLEEIRAIAQTGLHYAKDPHDQERYKRLFDLCVTQYARISDLSESELKARLNKDLGAVSPKVAASTAIFDEDGRILLMRRTDDGKWAIPGGLSEVYETPVQTAVREAKEEVGLIVKAESLIDVFCRFAGEYGFPHTTYSLMYWCTVQDGKLSTSSEAKEVGYFDHKEISEGDWHTSFRERVQKAYEFWEKNVK